MTRLFVVAMVAAAFLWLLAVLVAMGGPDPGLLPADHRTVPSIVTR